MTTEAPTARLYECMFLISQSEAASLNTVLDHIREIIGRGDAEILAMRKWDERRLAFEIDKQKRGLYVLAYFTADPCGPCQQFKRDTLANDRVAGVIDEKTIPVYIDIDENGTAASQYRVQGVPTTLLIRDGEVIARAVGYANPDDFIAFIEDNTVAAAEPGPQAAPLTPAD